jgi:hypothetical protein
MLAMDFRGAATYQSEYLKSHRPHGVDYSRSYVASGSYARVFGVLAAIVGTVFVVAGVLAHGP